MKTKKILSKMLAALLAASLSLSLFPGLSSAIMMEDSGPNAFASGPGALPMSPAMASGLVDNVFNAENFDSMNSALSKINGMRPEDAAVVFAVAKQKTPDAAQRLFSDMDAIESRQEPMSDQELFTAAVRAHMLGEFLTEHYDIWHAKYIESLCKTAIEERNNQKLKQQVEAIKEHISSVKSAWQESADASPVVVTAGDERPSTLPLKETQLAPSNSATAKVNDAAVGADGRIYDVDPVTHEIKISNVDGSPVKTVGTENRVQIFNLDGTYSHTIGAAQPVEGKKNITVGKDGRIYVADDHGKGSNPNFPIYVYDAQGRFAGILDEDAKIPDFIVKIYERRHGLTYGGSMQKIPVVVDGQKLYVVNNYIDDQVDVWNDKKLRYSIKVNFQATAMVGGPNETVFIAGYQDNRGRIFQFDLKSGKTIRTIALGGKGNNVAITSMALSHDKKILYALGREGVSRIELASYRGPSFFAAPHLANAPYYSPVLSHNDRYLTLLSYGGEVSILDTSRDYIVDSYRDYEKLSEGYGISFAFSPDDKTLTIHKLHTEDKVIDLANKGPLNVWEADSSIQNTDDWKRAESMAGTVRFEKTNAKGTLDGNGLEVFLTSDRRLLIKGKGVMYVAFDLLDISRHEAEANENRAKEHPFSDFSMGIDLQSRDEISDAPPEAGAQIYITQSNRVYVREVRADGPRWKVALMRKVVR